MSTTEIVVDLSRLGLVEGLRLLDRMQAGGAIAEDVIALVDRCVTRSDGQPLTFDQYPAVMRAVKATFDRWNDDLKN